MSSTDKITVSKIKNIIKIERRISDYDIYRLEEISGFGVRDYEDKNKATSDTNKVIVEVKNTDDSISSVFGIFILAGLLIIALSLIIKFWWLFVPMLLGRFLIFIKLREAIERERKAKYKPIYTLFLYLKSGKEISILRTCDEFFLEELCWQLNDLLLNVAGDSSMSIQVNGDVGGNFVASNISGNVTSNVVETRINQDLEMNNSGDTYNVGQAGSVGKYARSDGNTFIQSEQKQTLAQAAAEIQKLLKQLEETYPTATEAEKINYVNDETTPSFKRRVVGALQSGGEAAIEEFLDNPYVSVVKATIKGWLKPE